MFFRLLLSLVLMISVKSAYASVSFHVVPLSVYDNFSDRRRADSLRSDDILFTIEEFSISRLERNGKVFGEATLWLDFFPTVLFHLKNSVGSETEFVLMQFLEDIVMRGELSVTARNAVVVVQGSDEEVLNKIETAFKKPISVTYSREQTRPKNEKEPFWDERTWIPRFNILLMTL